MDWCIVLSSALVSALIFLVLFSLVSFLIRIRVTYGRPVRWDHLQKGIIYHVCGVAIDDLSCQFALVQNTSASVTLFVELPERMQEVLEVGDVFKLLDELDAATMVFDGKFQDIPVLAVWKDHCENPIFVTEAKSIFGP